MGERESPHKTAKAWLDAAKAGTPNQFKMGGTGSKQEDQIITVIDGEGRRQKMTYIPFKGRGEGGAARRQAHRPTVNNPYRGRSRTGAPGQALLCVFDKEPMPCWARPTQSWNDLPDLRLGRHPGRT